MATIPTVVSGQATGYTNPTPDLDQPSYNPDRAFKLDLNPLRASNEAQTNALMRGSEARAGVGAAAGDLLNSVDKFQTKQAMIDATNRENGFQADLQHYLYNPDDGVITTRKGNNANGVSKEAEAYIGTLREKYMDGVSNPMAQEQLNKALPRMGNEAVQTTDIHEGQQRNVAATDALKDTIDNSNNAVSFQWKDDKVYGDESIKVMNAAQHRAVMLGQDPANAVRDAVSGLAEARINAAVRSDKPEDVAFAGQLFRRYTDAGVLTSDSLDRVGRYMRTVIPKAQGNLSFQQDMNAGSLAQPQGPLPDLGAIKQGIYRYESNFAPGAIGPTIPGQGAAKGVNQVMDATNWNPGFGVKAAQDNSPAERKRVGDDYIGAMQQKYGDMRLALAAYNAGPGTVDKALKTSDPRKGGDYGQFINALPDPQQTGPYIQHVMSYAQASSGQAPGPQLLDESKAMAKAATMEPEAGQVYMENVTRHNTQQKAAWTQAQNDVADKIQPILQASNGQWSAVSTALQAQAAQYGIDKKLRENKGEDDENVKNAFGVMTTDQLATVNLSDPFYRQHLSASSFNEIAKEQAKINNDPNEKAIGKLVDASVDYALQSNGQFTAEQIADLARRREGRLGGIGGNAADFDRVAAFRSEVKQQITDWRAANPGKVPQANDVNKITDGILMDRSNPANPVARQYPTAQTETQWGGLSHPFTFSQQTVMKGPGSLSITDIPVDVRTAIENQLRGAGTAVNVDSVKDFYMQMIDRGRR